MPGNCGCGTLAAWLRVPGLRRQAVLSGDDPQSLSVHQVPPADVADCRDDLCLDTSAAAAMVSRYLSPDPDQARHLQHRTGSSPWGDADHRLESQTQVEAGHA